MANFGQLSAFFDKQLAQWPQAAGRYEALRQVRTREVQVGDYNVRLQFNPARAVSSQAKLDKASIAARPCFLCRANRPEQQFDVGWFEDFEVLVNPFPIFEPHLTIVSHEHQPQENVDFFRMAEIAKTLPGMTTFYNGSRAGASAPDHLHLQACQQVSLPVCARLETNCGRLLKSSSEFQAYCPEYLPWNTVHFVSQDVTPEINRWLTTLLPENTETGLPDRGLCNVLIWTDANGALHTLFVPRAKHRPECYFEEDPDRQLLVSPGAIDMAGTLILTRERDFEKMTVTDVRRIYDEVSFYYTDSPQFQKLLML